MGKAYNAAVASAVYNAFTTKYPGFAAVTGGLYGFLQEKNKKHKQTIGSFDAMIINWTGKNWFNPGFLKMQYFFSSR